MGFWVALTLVWVVPIKPNEKQLLSPVTESRHAKMEACRTDFILVTFISLSLLLLRREARAASEQFQATLYMNNNTSICHDGLMSVYISKVQFAGLPFTIYVGGKSDTKNISYPWHVALMWSFAMLLSVSKCAHRWTQGVSSSHRSSKTMPLLPERNWHLYNPDSCFPRMFCKKTSELKSLLSLSVCSFLMQIYAIVFSLF